MKRSRRSRPAPQEHDSGVRGGRRQRGATVDGVDGQGKPAHNEWTGKFDGKDYPVTGDTASDVRSYKQIDDHTLGV